MSKIHAEIIENTSKEMHHSHPYAQIVIPLVSHQFLQTEYGDYWIDASSLVFIPPNLDHKYKSTPGNRVLIINIPPHHIKKTDISKFDISSRFSVDKSLALLIQLIVQELETDPDSPSFKYLYFFLYDKMTAQKKSDSIAYISTHYEEHIHISDLANMEHYNVNYYREWFKKQTGLRPKEYIQRLRIEKAKELLLTTKYSISEIANQIGYDHSSSFLRAFKASEGITPNAFRKKGAI